MNWVVLYLSQVQAQVRDEKAEDRVLPGLPAGAGIASGPSNLQRGLLCGSPVVRGRLFLLTAAAPPAIVNCNVPDYEMSDLVFQCRKCLVFGASGMTSARTLNALHGKSCGFLRALSFEHALAGRSLLASRRMAFQV